MELSPEEREKIYEEEKVKKEAQDRLDKEKKAKDSKKGCFGCLGIIVLIFIISSFTGSCGSSKSENPQNPATTTSSQQTDETKKKQQQEAFLNWYAGLEIQMKSFDSSSKIWTETFNQLGNNTISRHQAYAQLKPLLDTMSGFMTTFNNIEPPAALSKEHQKILKDGTQEFSTMAYCRKSAIEKGLKFIDDMKPSSMQEALEDAKSANAHMLKGAAKLTIVRAQLGLVENKQ